MTELLLAAESSAATSSAAANAATNDLVYLYKGGACKAYFADQRAARRHTENHQLNPT